MYALHVYIRIGDIDHRLYENLNGRLREHRRSASQEVIHILELDLSDPEATKRNGTDELLKRAGAWADGRSAAEIMADPRNNRGQSERFCDSHDAFD